MRTLVFLAAFSVAYATHGSLIEFTDRDDWQDAAGDATTIGFVGLPKGTFVTDQYEDLGVLFDGGFEVIDLSSIFRDGAGLTSGQGGINMSFTQPMTRIAVDFTGDVQFQLYMDERLIGESSIFFSIEDPAFGGVISTEPFNRAVMFDPDDPSVVIDNLYFGPPIPAPGVLAVIAVLWVAPRRRR